MRVCGTKQSSGETTTVSYEREGCTVFACKAGGGLPKRSKFVVEVEAKSQRWRHWLEMKVAGMASRAGDIEGTHATVPSIGIVPFRAERFASGQATGSILTVTWWRRVVLTLSVQLGLSQASGKVQDLGHVCISADCGGDGARWREGPSRFRLVHHRTTRR